jgi:hypothetical protein
MSDEDPIIAVSAVPDRIDSDGNSTGISLKMAMDAVKEHTAEKRERLSGDLDMKGEKVTSLMAETVQATMPLNDAWHQEMGKKYPHLDGMDSREAIHLDENFARDFAAADEMLRVLQEGHRRAIADREHAEFRRLRPQALANGEVGEKFSHDAIDYLKEVKGLTAKQAFEAYNRGGLGRGTEQAKLHDKADAWARDKRELKQLNAARNSDESMTLRQAQRRAVLMKRLGK